MRLNNLNVIMLLSVHLIGIGNAEADRRKLFPNPGDKAPELISEDWLNAENGIRLRNLRGKVVVLDFWETWCHPCLEGMPHLQELYDRYKSQGLVVVGLTEAKPNDYILELVKKLGITYPIGAGKDYGELYRCPSIPTVFIIDRNGIVAWRSLNNMRLLRQELDKEVEKALRKK